MAERSRGERNRAECACASIRRLLHAPVSPLRCGLPSCITVHYVACLPVGLSVGLPACLRGEGWLLWLYASRFWRGEGQGAVGGARNLSLKEVALKKKTRGYKQEQSGTIGHNETQSGTIGHNQTQPGTVGHNQTQPGTIGHNQTQPGTSILFI